MHDTPNPKVLITGASGLLGRALVAEFVQQGFTVLAQCHQNPPPVIQAGENNLKNASIGQCLPLVADFSDLAGIRGFLHQYDGLWSGCGVLINNYGPITSKDITALRGEDFMNDYFHNVVPAFEITDYFLKNQAVKVVVNIGFATSGVIRPYRKILPYAAAKNALLLLTQSFEMSYPHVRFIFIAMPTLAGAAVPAPHQTPTPPHTMAQEIFHRVYTADLSHKP